MEGHWTRQRNRERAATSSINSRKKANEISIRRKKAIVIQQTIGASIDEHSAKDLRSFQFSVWSRYTAFVLKHTLVIIPELYQEKESSKASVQEQNPHDPFVYMHILWTPW